MLINTHEHTQENVFKFINLKTTGEQSQNFFPWLAKIFQGIFIRLKRTIEPSYKISESNIVYRKLTKLTAVENELAVPEVRFFSPFIPRRLRLSVNVMDIQMQAHIFNQ